MWLELGRNRTESEAARRILEDARHQVYTSPVTLAEIVSVLLRKGARAKVSATLHRIRAMSSVSVLDEVLFENAGAVHAEERARQSNFSLADALILASARALSATLLTTDRGFVKNRQGVPVRLL